MGLRLTVFGACQIAGIVTVTLATAAWNTYRAVDHRLNYSQVVAAVDSVETRCRPSASTKPLRDEIAADPEWKGQVWGGCDAAEAWVWSHDRHFVVQHRDIAYVRFISPVDRQEHSGTFELPRAPTAPIVGGGHVTLWVHDKDPSRLEPV
jgi:hypothetical protein